MNYRYQTTRPGDGAKVFGAVAAAFLIYLAFVAIIVSVVVFVGVQVFQAVS